MAFSLKHSRLVSVGLASVIAVGVIGVGSVALADDDSSTDGAPQQATADGRTFKHAIPNLVKNTGVSLEELKEGAAAGLTLGQIVDQYGDISAEQAKAAALTAIGERLDAAVADGKLTQERADELESKSASAIDRVLATVPGELRDGGKPGARIFKIAKHSLETVAGVLGTDVATLRQQLADGQTIAEIAGPNTQAVVDALVEDANTAIDRAVADGNLPADKADEAKTRAAAAIEKFVNEGRPERPQGGFLPKRLRPGAN